MALERPPPMDGSSGPETKVHRGTATKRVSTALYGLYVSHFAVYSDCVPVSLRKENDLCFPMVQLTVSKPRIFEYFPGFRFFSDHLHSPAPPGTAPRQVCVRGTPVLAYGVRGCAPGDLLSKSSVDGESTLPRQLPRQRTPGLSHSNNHLGDNDASRWAFRQVRKAGFLVLT